MSENLHDIDKLFKNSIEGHEEMPSEKVWDAIDNNLDKTNVIQIKRKYNNLKRLAVALLLLLLGTVIYEIQSKKTGKEELVKNNGKETKTISNNNTKEQTNVADEKTANKKDEKKLNGSENTTTTTNSTASGNDEVNNAGKDVVNNAGKDVVNNTGKDQGNTVGKDAANNTRKGAEKNDLNHSVPQDKDDTAETTTGGLRRNSKGGKTRTKINISKPSIENGNDVANGKTADQLGNKTTIKKSTLRKTNVRIKNGTVDEGSNTAENNAAKNAGNKSVALANTNELKALQNDKAEKITATQKNAQLNINEKRISPDANVKNAVAKNNKNPKPFHFNVTAFYSPQFGSNRLEDEHHDPTAPPPGGGREEIKKDEPHEKSSSLGILVQVPVGKRWSVQTGVTLTNKKINIEPKKIFAKLDNDGKLKYRFDCSSGYTYISTKTVTNPAAVGDSVNVTASSNSLQYVGIPLLASYTFSVGKFSIIPTTGTGINILTKQRIETELVQGTTKEKQTINTIQGLKKTYFNAFAGISLEYNVSKRVAVNVTPSGNFALSSINKDAAVKSYPNSFGVAAGIKIKF